MSNQVLTMPKEKYYVYIITDAVRSAIYTGVTNDLRERMRKHREGTGEGFTDKRGASALVYYEVFDEPYSAISREKALKAASREDKMLLIQTANQTWTDLFPNL